MTALRLAGGGRDRMDAVMCRMNPPPRSWRNTALILGLVLALPFVGARIAGRDLTGVFAFPPPLHIPLQFPHWSWVACGLVLAPFAALGFAWIRAHRWATHRVTASDALAAAGVGDDPPGRTFPVWGWVAVIWIIAVWIIAWNRFGWFAGVQRHTFFPLWIGFVVATNAVTCWRTGHCLMLRAPLRWARLFVASAAFWWVFEWLNRFARNWHYLGVSDLGPWSYALNATLCFSTVLPAVTAVAELLLSTARWRRALLRGPKLRWLSSRRAVVACSAIGIIGLLGTGADPRHFYPALWAAPLALLVAADILQERSLLARQVAVGNWQHAASWAAAALICGVFWELWNVHSAAKWIYTVPYVDRWHLFEMPVLGYTGYLPFGLECRYVACGVLGGSVFSSASST